MKCSGTEKELLPRVSRSREDLGSTRNICGRDAHPAAKTIKSDRRYVENAKIAAYQGSRIGSQCTFEDNIFKDKSCLESYGRN
jgi:hypothetical protein